MNNNNKKKKAEPCVLYHSYMYDLCGKKREVLIKSHNAVNIQGILTMSQDIVKQ